MAEILIKYTPASHPDPDTDRAGCYKAGMPVVVQKNQHVWGLRESLPRFAVFKFPDRTEAELLPYNEPQMVQDGFEEDGVTPKYVTYRVRRYQFDLPSFPQAAQDTLAATGALTFSDTGDMLEAEAMALLVDHENP